MKLLAFDVETWGVEPAYALQPFRARSGHAWLTSYAVAVLGRQGDVSTAGELFPTIETLRLLLVRCAETKTRIVAWNAIFDIAWLIALGLREEVMACRWLDAMHLYQHVTNHPRFMIEDGLPTTYALKPAVAKFFPEDAGYEADIDFGTTDEAELDALLVYNRLDSKHTLRLAVRFLSEMTPEQKRAALIEASCLPMIAETIVQGIAANAEAASVLDKQLEQDADVAFVTLKMSAPNDVSTEVLASPAKLRLLLFDKWCLTPIKQTDTGLASTDKDTLSHLAMGDPRADLIRDYREATNGRTKFVTATISSLAYNGDGRVRPGPRVFGTYTSRLTYASKQGKGKASVQTGIALHQWKRDKAFRRLLVAPPGYDLLEDDFAGQEFRWMAVESGDETMLSLCAPGEDAHSYMAARVRGLDYRTLQADHEAEVPGAKDIRQLGKVGNLSLQYRTGWMTFQSLAYTDYGVTLTDAEARAIHATYQVTYLKVPVYWKRQIRLGKRNGYVENLAGRRVFVGTSDVWDPASTWKRASTSINFPIQSIGGEQKYLALAILKDYLNRVDGKFYFDLHDGLFSIVPERKSEKAAHDIRDLLSNLPYDRAWGRTFPIQFPVDGKIGKSWGDLKGI